MNKIELKESIKFFYNNHKGKSVIFCGLKNDEERFVFVLLQGYKYFKSFLSGKEAAQRALKNAEAHKKDGFINYPFDKIMEIKTNHEKKL